MTSVTPEMLLPTIGTPVATTPCHHTVDVTFTAEQVAAVRQLVSADFLRHGRVPGFRPGHSPKDMVLRRFAPQIADQVKEKLLSTGVRHALANEAVKPIIMPSLVAGKEGVLLDGTPFAFTIEYDCKPQITPPTYKGVALTRRAVTIDEARVDAVLDNVRKQRTTYEAVTRPVAQQDIVRISYTVTLAAPPADLPDDAKRVLQASETWAQVGGREAIPGLAAGLVGLSPEAEATVALTFPADYAEPALRGLAGSAQVKLHEVQCAVQPELNDELAKTLGVESMAALRENIRANLSRELQEMQQMDLHGQLYEHVMKGAEFPLPPAMLNMEEEMSFNELVRKETQAGKNLEAINDKLDSLRTEASQTAENRLRFRYLIEDIAQREEIKVDESDVEEAMEAYRESRKLTPAQFAKQFNLDAMASMARWSLLRERTLAKLVEWAVITEAAATPPEMIAVSDAASTPATT